MLNNPLEITRLIKEPLDKEIPNELKDKVEFKTVEAGTPSIQFSKGVIDISENGAFNVSQSENPLLEFKGLPSKIAYVNLEGDNLQEVRQEILNDMDEKETKLVLNAIKKFKNKKVIMVRRRISPEIVEIMGYTKGAQRALIVTPSTVTKEGDKSGKLYYAVYAYESIIIALENKTIKEKK